MGAYTCDANGLITNFNKLAAEAWGREPALNDPGERFCGSFRLFAVDGTPMLRDDCWMALALKETRRFAAKEVIIERPDGSRRAVLSHASPLFDEAGAMVGAVNILLDITDRKLAEDAMRARKDELDSTVRHLNAVLRQMPMAIAVVDAPSGRVVLANDKSAEVFPQAAVDDVAAVRGFVGLHEDGTAFDPHEWPLARSITTGEIVVGEDVPIVRRDGTRGYVRVTSSPIRSENGSIVAGVVTYGDVTEEVFAKRQIESHLQELKNANRMKDEFLATVSHELRTPLNAILGWVRMLRSDALSAEKRERALETIERNATSQAQLIEDLLDVSRIISGKVRLDVATVDVAAVVENALDSVRPAASAKGVTLHQVVDPSAGPVLGDSERLQQIVWNLLANAVKFTPKNGAVRVAVNRREPFVDIVVADDGAGIESDFLPSVFDRFRQADATPAREHGGLGIGLAIVRHLVDLHGGTVRAESEGLGKGTTFTVSLPILSLRSRTLERTTPKPTTDPRPSELSGVQILVVDDEPDARELMSELLTSREAQVLTAGTVDEAIRLVKEHRPDIVISDIGMPGEDGYALVRKLRALPASDGGKTPAVALTAYACSEDRTKALIAGFNMHVPKPVEPAELFAVLASLAAILPPT